MKELTSFVYRLYYPGYDQCYIGQARVPEMRYKCHIGKLQRNSHQNKYIQAFYNETGLLPLMEILIEVELPVIDAVEQFYIGKYIRLLGIKCFNIKYNPMIDNHNENKYIDNQSFIKYIKNY